ncbi:ubiquitin-like-conjugating enzyme ATG10 isoform X2 [Physella acuta]|uniref:ubiquitin-like-conjugating enzyme ATG10 isoform X2 n=1 Tax=Physella acuta TaxID=109671 RepID=UPI0027DCA5AB|nr:ubiquitin-like-conjugating enzyme ATG10 isoform X2 [Physella acuta]
MAAGSITQGEFSRIVETFVDISNKIDDKWHMESGINNTVFMHKKCNVISPSDASGSSEISNPPKNVPLERLTKCSASDPHEQNMETLVEMEIADESDSSCMPLHRENETYTYEYHVLYSESYQVPVLYFNVFKKDGKLLSLEDVWKLCPVSYQKYMNENKWATLSQQEHPLLGRPYFQLHPCHTSDLMSQIMTNTKTYNIKNYLATWLSTVGPLVGLSISPAYITDV